MVAQEDVPMGRVSTTLVLEIQGPINCTIPGTKKAMKNNILLNKLASLLAFSYICNTKVFFSLTLYLLTNKEYTYSKLRVRKCPHCIDVGTCAVASDLTYIAFFS